MTFAVFGKYSINYQNLNDPQAMYKTVSNTLLVRIQSVIITMDFYRTTKNEDHFKYLVVHAQNQVLTNLMNKKIHAAHHLIQKTTLMHHFVNGHQRMVHYFHDQNDGNIPHPDHCYRIQNGLNVV